ncbi:MAG: BrnT family toxin [Oxalobacter formigenes]|nr:BrnT family toxin [Oxalobacter formigenes]
MAKLGLIPHRTDAVCQIFFTKLPKIIDQEANCGYNIIIIKITFDPKKNQKNIEERGLSFERVTEIDFQTAVFREDTRKDYGETRIRLLGKIAESSCSGFHDAS